MIAENKRSARKKRWEKIREDRARLEEYEPKYNPFAEIYYSNPNQMMLIYPYFQNRIMSHLCEDREFAFRTAIDWDAESYEDTELICLTGNSETYGLDTYAVEKTIGSVLEDKLNGTYPDRKFKVLNFGISGATVVNEMLYYLLLIKRLKPKYVISISGFDLFTSHFVSEKLLKTHLLPYSSYSEKVCKELYKSDIPLCGESRYKNKKITSEDVVEAFCYRAEQFYEVVDSETKFIFAIQPFLSCKNKVHKTERNGYRRWLVDYGSREWREIIDSLANLSYASENRLLAGGKIKEIVNFNMRFKDSRELLFEDWIHTNEVGNELIAHYLFNAIVGPY